MLNTEGFFVSVEIGTEDEVKVILLSFSFDFFFIAYVGPSSGFQPEVCFSSHAFSPKMVSPFMFHFSRCHGVEYHL